MTKAHRSLLCGFSHFSSQGPERIGERLPLSSLAPIGATEIPAADILKWEGLLMFLSGGWFLVGGLSHLGKKADSL